VRTLTREAKGVIKVWSAAGGEGSPFERGRAAGFRRCWAPPTPFPLRPGTAARRSVRPIIDYQQRLAAPARLTRATRRGPAAPGGAFLYETWGGVAELGIGVSEIVALKQHI
jgi:hypothetical protein